MNRAWILAAASLLAARSHAAVSDCAPCHKAEVSRFSQAAMTRALEPAPSSAILTGHPTLSANIGGFSKSRAASTP
jgi:hypothetical protein